MHAIEWKRVCCPVDFSGLSLSAVEAAAELARRLGAELTLLHVESPQEAFSEGRMEEYRKVAQARGVAKVELGRTSGDPSIKIGDFAQQGGFDLIVMGTHGRTGRAASLSGSVAETVVRNAKCPVLTLHEGWPKHA
jgi:nucleotide-binding universal stress UspA family protein